MINDPFHPEEAIAREQESNKRKLLAAVCAVAVTALLLVGYGYIRKYHAQKVIANNTPPPVVETGPKGPPLAHIVIDEPSLSKRYDDDWWRNKEHLETGINQPFRGA